jgi:PmbA protein
MNVASLDPSTSVGSCVDLVTLAGDVVERALRGGADVAEALVRRERDLNVRMRKGAIELLEEAGRRSLALRVMRERRTGLVSTSDLGSTGLARAVADALELAELSEEDPCAGPVDRAEVAAAQPDLGLFDPRLGNFGVPDAIELATTIEDSAARFDSRITNNKGANVSRKMGEFALALSNGWQGIHRSSALVASITALADDDGGKKRRGQHYAVCRSLDGLGDPREIGRNAARRAIDRLGTRKIATCKAPVIFGPLAMRSILGNFAACVVGHAVMRKLSYLHGREGQRVASDALSIVDDPLIPGAIGSRPFDGEGLPSRRNVVVNRGILATYLHDSYSARKLGRAPTASANRGPTGAVGTSTSNFVMQPGPRSAEEIIAATERGLYVDELMGTGFQPSTGTLSRGACGFWIENGRFVYPVGEVVISSNIDHILHGIELVGDDVDWRSPIACPTVRVSSMTIAGR